MSEPINPIAWQPRLRTRLLEQFKDDPSWQQFSDIIAAQAQDVENAFQSLVTLVSIDDSAGVQLQTLGRIVGQPYTREDDPTYRLRVRARIKANMSSGDPGDLYAVFVAMFSLPTPGQAKIISYGTSPAALVFRVLLRVLTPVEAAVLFDLLIAAKMGGVTLMLEWPPSTPDDLFAFDGGPGLGWGSTLDATIGGCRSGALAG